MSPSGSYHAHLHRSIYLHGIPLEGLSSIFYQQATKVQPDDEYDDKEQDKNESDSDDNDEPTKGLDALTVEVSEIRSEMVIKAPRHKI